MHSLWIRCLAALLSLALVSWNAHAMAHDGGAFPDHCQGDPDQARMAGAHDHHAPHHGSADKRCCCDYVACTAAAIVAPALAVGTVEFSAVSYRSVRLEPLAIRTALLDPDPPRSSALS